VPTHHEVRVDDGFDGEAVAAVHHPADGDGDRWLVCCHGFASDKTGIYADWCDLAVDAGYDAVRFDARGVGDSAGAFDGPLLSRRVSELDAVLTRFDADPAVLLGSSFGGAVALVAADTDDRVAGVVGRAPVTDTAVYDAAREAVADDGEWEHPSGPVVGRQFVDDLATHDLSAVAERVTVPVAFVHGAEDDTVPPADTFASAERVGGAVLVERLTGQGHVFDDRTSRRTIARALDWLDDRL